MGHNKIIDGVFHPSVTGMTGIMPKAWMPHWYASEERKGLLRAIEGMKATDALAAVMEYLDKPRCTDLLCVCEANKKKTAGGNAGTNFHEAVEAHLLKKPVPKLSGGEERAFKRFLGWLKKHKVEYLMRIDGRPMLELHIRNTTWKYVGTFDGLCIVDGVLRVVDWKTSNNMDPTFMLQIAAYGQGAVEEGLLNEMPGGLILRCDKREKPWERAVDEELLTPDEMKENFKVFASLRRPYDFAMRHGLLKVGG